MADGPVKVIGISGKRMVGKDFFCGVAKPHLEAQGFKVLQLALADAFKLDFCQSSGCDYARLLADREYKEQHRQSMNTFFEKQNQLDPYKYCDMVCHMAKGGYDILLIPDLRLAKDKLYLQQQAAQVTWIRIECEETIRKQFGWVYTEKVDSHFTECDLDVDQQWHYVVQNTGESASYTKLIKETMDACIK